MQALACMRREGLLIYITETVLCNILLLLVSAYMNAICNAKSQYDVTLQPPKKGKDASMYAEVRCQSGHVFCF